MRADCLCCFEPAADRQKRPAALLKLPTLPGLDAGISQAIHGISWHFNVTLNSAEEGLAYELPGHLMFATGVFLLTFGLASLIAGARVAQLLFSLVLAMAVGFITVQEEARDFLQGPHLEIELATTWAATRWARE